MHWAPNLPAALHTALSLLCAPSPLRVGALAGFEDAAGSITTAVLSQRSGTVISRLQHMVRHHAVR